MMCRATQPKTVKPQAQKQGWWVQQQTETQKRPGLLRRGTLERVVAFAADQLDCLHLQYVWFCQCAIRKFAQAVLVILF